MAAFGGVYQLRYPSTFNVIHLTTNLWRRLRSAHLFCVMYLAPSSRSHLGQQPTPSCLSGSHIWCPSLVDRSLAHTGLHSISSSSLKHLPLLLRSLLAPRQIPKPLQHISPCPDHDALNILVLTAGIHVAAELFASFDQRS
jgi:hypothetical protein